VISPQSAKLTRTNKKAEIASAVALLAAIVLVTVYSAIPHYKGVVGLFAIAAIVVSVTVYTKYISPVFFYDITFDGYGVPVFVVRQVIGRRETTLARLSLSEITEIRREDVEACNKLDILAESDEAGLYIIASKKRRMFYVTGHSEYDAGTLAKEYFRDVDRGLPIDLPKHYFPSDDPSAEPKNTWRGHAHLLFSNWLNYFVYQNTPYDITKIKPIE